jgi:hypothetical protein
MTDVTFSDNHALEAVGGDSGALRNDGTLSLVNVTIANNVTDDPGGDGSGGMENTGTLTITNSDIVGNTGAARAPRAPGDSIWRWAPCTSSTPSSRATPIPMTGRPTAAAR